MTLNKKEQKNQAKYKGAMKAKMIFMIITYVTAALFMGLIIYIIVQYGIDATANPVFETDSLILSAYIGIPLVSLTLASGISIGIINLILGTFDEEETTKEFKLIKEEEEK